VQHNHPSSQFLMGHLTELKTQEADFKSGLVSAHPCDDY
jgi:hypothetical protein